MIRILITLGAAAIIAGLLSRQLTLAPGRGGGNRPRWAELGGFG
jgi:hypothetical protein